MSPWGDSHSSAAGSRKKKGRGREVNVVGVGPLGEKKKTQTPSRITIRKKSLARRVEAKTV